ncbi:homeobox cut-like 1 isoform X3, partial [Brachionus plicatilis]
GPIRKSFQHEFDSATKRSKLMEQVILKLYIQPIDLPDPVQSLENLQRVKKKAERVQDLEIEKSLQFYGNQKSQLKD